MPIVYNKHHKNYPSDAIYVGRGSPYGNPYVIDHDMTRESVIALYKKLLNNNPKLVERIKKELKGKDLLCFCKPKPCHADVLMEIANE